MMRGWKTWLGAALVAGSAALEYLGHREISGYLLALGGAVGLVGIGHKVEKVQRNTVPVRRGRDGTFVKKVK